MVYGMLRDSQQTGNGMGCPQLAQMFVERRVRHQGVKRSDFDHIHTVAAQELHCAARQTRLSAGVQDGNLHRFCRAQWKLRLEPVHRLAPSQPMQERKQSYGSSHAQQCNGNYRRLYAHARGMLGAGGAKIRHPVPIGSSPVRECRYFERVPQRATAMSPAEELVEQLEQVLCELHHLAQQQQEALIALRLGAIEAVLAQQQSLLSRMAALEHKCGEHLEEIRSSASLRQRWERLRIQATELRRLLQLNALLAQRAQQHTTAFLEALGEPWALYDQRA